MSRPSVKRGLKAAHVLVGLEVLPAKAKVQSQILLQPPVVLEVDAVVGTLVAIGDFVGKTSAVLQVEQEVGDTETGVGLACTTGEIRGCTGRCMCRCRVTAAAAGSEKRMFWKLTPALREWFPLILVMLSIIW